MSMSKIFSRMFTPLKPNIMYRCEKCSACSGEPGGKNNRCGNKEGEEKPCPCCLFPSDSNPSTPTLYDSRKYGHGLPLHIVPDRFEQVPCIPNGIFRWTAGETLGPGAAKCSYYQVPEYFSYHHMTYYDMHLILRCCRKPSPKTGRKPN